MNNVTNDLTPYFLSANHCYRFSNGNVSDWTFWFNYESATCSNASSEPSHDGISGASFKARNAESDFLLLQLSTKPPASYNTFYAGWTSSDSPSRTSVIGIHHPAGDVKKISLDDETPSSFVDNGKQTWFVADWDNGTTEGGSSGSPLFNQNGRIIGQDYAGDGDPYCTTKGTTYGKFSVSWDYGTSSSTRLKDWLDPNSSGTPAIDGIEGPDPPPVTAVIDGPTYATGGSDVTLDAFDSYGGFTPYSYHWRYFVVCKDGGPLSPQGGDIGTNDVDCGGWYDWPDDEPTITRQINSCYDQRFELEVEDTAGNSDFDYHYVSAECSSSPQMTSGDSVATEQDLAAHLRTIEVPRSIILGANRPNPFLSTTTISFGLPEAMQIDLVVYDVLGREVARLVDAMTSSGYHQVTWNTNDIPAGIYFYRLRARDFTTTKRMLLKK